MQLKCCRWSFCPDTVLFRLSMLHKLHDCSLPGWCFHQPASASKSGLFLWNLRVRPRKLSNLHQSRAVSILLYLHKHSNIGTLGLADLLVYVTVSMATWHGHCAEAITSSLSHLLSHLAKIVMIACNVHTPALSHLCGRCAATVPGWTASAGSVQQTSPTLEMCDAMTTLLYVRPCCRKCYGWCCLIYKCNAWFRCNWLLIVVFAAFCVWATFMWTSVLTSLTSLYLLTMLHSHDHPPWLQSCVQDSVESSYL